MNMEVLSCLKSDIRWYNSNHYTIISTVLGRGISLEEAKKLYKEWNEFFNYPLDFIDTVVVDMVLKYLDEN